MSSSASSSPPPTPASSPQSSPPRPSNGQWYPPEWPDRIRALAAGEIKPVTPRLASTVMLLRDSPGHSGSEGGRDGGGARETGSGADTGTGGGPDTGSGAAGPAVHMLRRSASMAFAGGAYAYPGGGVDARDEREIAWAGPPLEWWAARFRTDEATAQAIVCAAVRETYEEAGVLLAGPDSRSVVGDTTGEDWEREREALVAHDLSFADFLDGRGLVLRSDLLGGWAHWITPEFERRRFDTWFFVAALREGQRTHDVSSEADRTVWIRPADAAAGYDRGDLLMMPPTIATLRQLAPYGSAVEALRASRDRDLTPVRAEARLEGDEVVLSWPGHEEFTKRVRRQDGDAAAAGTAGRAREGDEGSESA
jgi:8-oxo-dGTP pyrophosphatase MutT (NUDIX family)